MPRTSAELLLIVDTPDQRINVRARLVLYRFAPHVDHGPRRFGRWRPGQALAQDQPDHFGDGRIGHRLDAGIAAPIAVVLKGGIEVLRHARHARRAEGLHAHLFGGLVHRARRTAAGHQRAVDALVVVAQAQGKAVRGPACARNRLGGQLARR